MAQLSSSRRQVLTYVLLLFAFSSVFYFLIVRAHSISAGGGMYVLGLMWSPALATLLTLRLNGRKPSELGWKWGETRYEIQSWFIPLLYVSITYVIVWATGLGGFPNQEFVDAASKRMALNAPAWLSTLVSVLLMGSFGLVRALSSALGEEIGWRGFMVPELARSEGFTRTALISGAVWAVWHYPILIFGDYNAGTPIYYGLTCFTVMILATSFVFTWMRLRSGSLWTGAMLHASHNLYTQWIFTPLTRNTGKTAWFIDEFGAVMPLVTVAFAIYFWRRRGELELPHGAAKAPPHAGAEPETQPVPTGPTMNRPIS